VELVDKVPQGIQVKVINNKLRLMNIVKISIWFLFISIPGLLVLFLLVRNITSLDDLKKESGQEDANIMNNRGEMMLLYLFGIIALTIAFFD